MPLDRSGQLLGQYRLLRKLGAGGMGAVYEAVAASGKPVAVKVMTGDESNPSSLRRFVREARSVQAIQSRHVVKVIDVGGHEPGDGPPFLVMELLRGCDLGALVRRVGPLDPRVAARLFVQAARGIEAAHRQGILHRDLKPANLFLHDAGGFIEVKVCDFGVAKRLASAGDPSASIDLTRTGGLLGSPVYMSPEQAGDARQIDARSDLWSLSISLYEALAGRRPWQGCSRVGQIIVAICTTDIQPLRELAPWVSPELAEVVHRGLQRDAARRWPSAAELADALEALAWPGELTPRQIEEPLAAHIVAAAAAPQPPGPAGAETRSASQTGTQSLPGRPSAPPPYTVAAAPLAGALEATPRPDASRPASQLELSQGLSLASVVSPTAPVEPAPPAVPRRRALVPLALGSVGLLGLLGSLLGSRHEPQRPPTAPAASAASAAPVRLARVRVSPPEASVRVAGQPRPLSPSGDLELQGDAGERFEVEVSLGARSLVTHVVLLRDGRAEPAELSLPPSPPVLAPAPSQVAPAPVTGAPSVARGGVRNARGAPEKIAAPAPENLSPPSAPVQLSPKMHGDL